MQVRSVHRGKPMTTWTNEKAAGLLPVILRAEDARPAWEQLQERYAHGGGYMPVRGNWSLSVRPSGLWRLGFPGDPPYKEVSRTYLPKSRELLVLFECSFMVIVECPSASFTWDDEPGPFVVVRVD